MTAHAKTAATEHHGVDPAFTRRLAGIEGLRAIAAWSVLMTHVLNNSQPNGRAFDVGFISTYGQPAFHHGVILFFALSGFLLYLPFAAAALRDEPRPAISSYLRNRALRIIPAYWFVLFATALLLRSAQTNPEGDAIGAMTDPSLLVKNALLIQNYFPSSVNTGIGAMWSLAVELVFYLVLPLLVVVALALARRCATRARKRVALLAPAAIMALVGLAGTAVAPRGGATGATWDRVWDVSIFTHAHLFAFGLALAVVRAEYQDGRLRLPRNWRPITAAVLVGLGAITLQLGVDDRIAERFEVAMVSVLCGLLLALTVLTPRGPLGSKLVSGLESRALVGGGLISYSVFLWHVPVIYFLRKQDLTLNGGLGAMAANVAAVAAITGFLAWLTWMYVEKPALRRKTSKRVRTQTPGESGPGVRHPAPVAASAGGERAR
jgi:peptidoglycan/LPS O-acetylase OafA/YrhL